MIPFLHGALATNGGVANDFELIETQTVGAGGAASVTFSSIPGTYKHLQIRGIARTGYSGGYDALFAQVGNGSVDTSTANYVTHALRGDGSSASSNYTGTGTADSAMRFGIVSDSSHTSNVFGVFVLDFLDYANTSKNKTSRSLSGFDNNGSGYVEFRSAIWLSTAAMNTIKISDMSNASNLAQYSTFSLYGVK